MTDYSHMTAPELAQAAAARMGWPEISRNAPYSQYKGVYGGVICEGTAMEFHHYGGVIPFEYDPSTNLNHAVSFGASFLAKFPSCYLVVEMGRSRDSVSVYGANSQAISRVFGVSASEATARTICILQAWEALDGGK